MNLNRYVVIAAAAVVLVGGGAAGYVAWKQYEASQLPAGIVSVNGRVEATQVDISTKIAGRVIEIVPHEGDLVSPGEVVARIDTSETIAQLHQAQAAAELARQTVATRLAEVASDDAQLQFANEEMRRTATLVAKGWSTHEQYDQRTQQLNSADAALKAAKSQVDEAQASVKTADAKVEELQAVIDDFDDQVAGPRPGAVSPRRAGGGASCGRQDRDGDRSLGRLHDHISSRSAGGAAQDRRRRARGGGRGPGIRLSRHGLVRRARIAVHPQDGRGPVRARAAHVSRQAPGAAPVAQEHRGSGQGGLARRGLCEDRSLCELA